MKFYIVAMRETMVHCAFSDRPIKADISPEETFDLYHSLNKVNLFLSADDAVKHAVKQYYSEKHQPTPFQDSVQLSNAYPRDLYVTMRKKPIPLIYEVEGPDVADLEQNKIIVTVPKDLFSYPTPDIQAEAYRLEDKNKLTLNYVCVSGLVNHNTKDYAKKENKPLVQKLVMDDVEAATPKADCRVM